MPYDSIVSRSGMSALVPEEVSNTMLANLSSQSAALSLFSRIPVSRNQTRFPIIASLPQAYFVDGDTGLKQTTTMAWDNKYLNIEELAVIVPIPEAVLDDSGYDVWGAVRPLMEQAISRKIDAAVFFGDNKPASWPTSLAAGATAAGNTVTRGTAAVDKGGIAEDLNQLMAKVEADGYGVTGFVSDLTFKAKLRAARATDGQKLLDVSTGALDGVPVTYALDGQWPTASGSAELLAGQWSQGIIGVRQDFTYKILDQAVLQNGDGQITYNLPQQDMIALRLVFRLGFQVANPINYREGVEENRYPFSVMLKP